MHKSRLAGFIIDCRTDDLAAAADFWARALGVEIGALPDAEGEKYVRLVDRASELHTDDIEGEVRRLEALGARRATGWKPGA